MKNTQGLGWLAAGIVALGLNGFYHDGGLALAHRVADRISASSEAVVALASERADDLVARLEMVPAAEQTQSCRLTNAAAHLQNRIARVQAKFDGAESARADKAFARFEAMSDREQAEMHLLQANRTLVEARAAHFRVAAFDPVAVRISRLPVVCPRVRVLVPRIEVSQPDIHVSVPSIRINTSGQGPL